MIRVSIIGANGYTGMELMRLLAAREDVKLIHLVSRSCAGTPVTGLYPGLVPLAGRVFEDADPGKIAADSDVVFSCLPHAASAELCALVLRGGAKVIDLSADFRYRNLATYESRYKVKHPAPELNGEAVYGLPELYAEKIAGARLVANPGCYTTCSILALYPLLAEKVISPAGIVIDAKSGTSGAGRKAEISSLFTEVNESFKAYGVTTHRHTSEIEEQLSLAAGGEITLNFTPHLLPVQRGIFSTIYCDLRADAAAAAQAYAAFYGDKRFVVVNPEGTLPELKHAARSNYCMIGFKADPRTRKLIVVSVLDNLVKGASGQAVQNMNLMFGLPEETGLTAPAHNV